MAVDWPPPYRAGRIAAVLGDSAGSHDVTDSVILQQDIVASAAERILSTLLATTPVEVRAREAVSRLRAWDRQMHRNAPEPLILQAWVWALGRTLLADELGPNYLEFLDGGTYPTARTTTTASGCADNVNTHQN